MDWHLFSLIHLKCRLEGIGEMKKSLRSKGMFVLGCLIVIPLFKFAYGPKVQDQKEKFNLSIKKLGKKEVIGAIKSESFEKCEIAYGNSGGIQENNKKEEALGNNKMMVEEEKEITYGPKDRGMPGVVSTQFKRIQLPNELLNKNQMQSFNVKRGYIEKFKSFVSFGMKKELFDLKRCRTWKRKGKKGRVFFKTEEFILFQLGRLKAKLEALNFGSFYGIKIKKESNTNLLQILFNIFDPKGFDFSINEIESDEGGSLLYLVTYFPKGYLFLRKYYRENGSLNRSLFRRR